MANRPLLHHALVGLRGAGVEEVAVVADDPVGDEIAAAVPDGAPFGVELRHVTLPGPHGDLAALSRARSFVGDAPAIVHRGEALLGSELAAEVVGFLDGGSHATVLAHGGGQLPLGVDLLAAGALHELGAVRGDTPLGDALIHMGEHGWTVERRALAQAWALGERAEDLLEGNRLALDRLSTTGGGVKRRVLIDPSAVIEDSVIHGPAAIGPGAVVRNSLVGPYTSIGQDATIENAEIEGSIVLAGAAIRHFGARLAGSIIGARARVERDFHLPRSLQVCVGDDSQLAFGA